ncbi:MAG: hypothetical protein JW723_01910 [Bacteroidales bacterium]|nr:hypothetical protein [Bacteroidales bacterium]
MYRKESQILVTMFSLILIPVIYALIVYNKYVPGNPDILNDLAFWGKRFIVLVPVMVVALIVIHIIFAIINKIVTNQDIPVITDEMDRLIDLKSIKISRWVTSVGFLLAFGSQAIGMQPWVMLATLISSCFLGGVVEGIVQIYFYRKGI